MFQGRTVRWETTDRWYEASIVRDLLDDWTVWRRWGSRHSTLGGSMVELAQGYDDACQRIKAIDRQRRARRKSYRIVPAS